jgi:MFS family permease
MLDAFDVMLFSLVLSSVMGELSLTRTWAGALGAITLLSSGLGGIVFGRVADRYGRRTAMMGSIIVYSVFTGACGLAQSFWQLALARVFVGLGMGGEWTSGAALVSESWPSEHRGKAIAFMHSFWAVGYAAAAIVVAFVLPQYGWRAVFFVGILPSLLVLWMRRSMPESAIWLSHQSTSQRQTASVGDLFSGRLGSLTALLTTLSLFTLFAYWGLNFWIPAYLSLPVAQGGLGFSTSATTALVLSVQVGTWLGLFSFGYVCDALGRRKAYLLYLIAGAVAILLYSRTQAFYPVMVLGLFAAFFGTGNLAGFGTISAEIYPTALRATGQGFAFNVGRLGSAFAPFLAGTLAQSHGFSTAFGLISITLIFAALTWIGLPETRGRQLA